MSDDATGTRAALGAVRQWSDANGLHLFAPMPADVVRQWHDQLQRRLKREAVERLLERHTYVRETRHPDGSTTREPVTPATPGPIELTEQTVPRLHLAETVRTILRTEQWRITEQQRDLAASTARLQALLSARGKPNAVWFDEALREPEVDPLAGVREVVARHLPREASW